MDYFVATPDGIIMTAFWSDKHNCIVIKRDNTNCGFRTGKMKFINSEYNGLYSYLRLLRR